MNNTANATKVRILAGTTAEFEVHRHGCADLKKPAKRMDAADGWTLEVAAGADVTTAVLHDVNEDFRLGNTDAAWEPSHVRVMPCAGGR